MNWREFLFKTLAGTPIWYLLPGRWQGFLCNCDLCRGEAA